LQNGIIAGGIQYVAGDVRRQFDDAANPACGIQHRRVGGLQPDNVPVAGDTFDPVPVKLPAAQLLPEAAVFRAAGIGGVA
jgi:hypothetical protein